jgi:hypothetical protein
MTSVSSPSMIDRRERVPVPLDSARDAMARSAPDVTPKPGSYEEWVGLKRSRGVVSVG